MTHRTDPQTFRHARDLRKNQTETEEILWQAIRLKQINGIKFRRQHAIGPYIADFCSPSHKLVIEVDGSPHLEQKDYDAQRLAYLKSKGYKVLHFWNNEVMNDLDGVIERIIQTIEK
jgi:very-short-patch-repair endonuclease